jgi:hypothetical protein
MDPLALRNFLKGLCAGRTPLYWHYFVSNAKTGKMEVHTAASGDQRKLFDIFAKVVGAQPTHEKLYGAFEKLKSANQALFKVKQELAELKTQADEDPSDKSVAEKLSKKEKEVETAELTYNNLKTEMDACAAALKPTCVFMEENLPYVKGVYKKEREEAAKSQMVTQWVKGGRAIRYKDVANTDHGGLFGKPPANTWKVKMLAFADIDSSDAASVDVDKVEALVKSGELLVQDDSGFYVVLTVEAVPGTGGVRGGGAGAPVSSKMKNAMAAVDWKIGGKNIKYRNVNTGALITKMPRRNTFKVKMSDLKFASINGLDITDLRLLDAVTKLVENQDLIPTVDKKNREVFVTLEVEPITKTTP